MAVAAGIGVADLLYMAGAALAAMILVSPAGQQATQQAVQSAADAIDNLSPQSQTDTQDKTDAPAVPTTTEQCKEKEKDPCKDLQEQIEEVIDELRTRWYQYQQDPGGLPESAPAVPDPRYGLRSRTGERQQYEDKQQRLRNLEEEWNDSGCGPDLPDVWEWLTKQLEDGSSTNPYDKYPPK